MKVALDVSPLQTGHKVRGVGYYLKNLKEAFEKYESEIASFTYFSSLSEIKNAEVVHFPYFDPFSKAVPFNLSVPTVCTIHDLTPIKFSKYFPAGLKGNVNWRINKYQAKKLAAVITDSESSKKDIINYLSYPKEKIHVVYLAADEKFSPQKLSQQRKEELIRKYHLPDTFALYVGDVTWNKNIPRLIKACIKKDIPLVLAGKALLDTDYDRNHPWNSDLVVSQELIAANKNVMALGFVDDNDLVDLYRLAAVFVMPSLYEGFGLPVIEAMQSGTPVVTSKEGSLPEVGGEAVMYVDAYSEESISDGIASVFSSERVRKELSEKGLKQAKKFSWKKTADHTIEVYKSYSSHER